MFRQEPQPPVKGKNLDDGCHAPRLRGHVVFSQLPRTSSIGGPRTSGTPLFLALLPVNSKRSGYSPQVPRLRGTRTVSAEASTSRKRQKPRRRVPCSSLAWACSVQPTAAHVFDWRAENIRYTGFLSLDTRQFKTVRVLAPRSTFERNKNCFGRSLNLP